MSLEELITNLTATVADLTAVNRQLLERLSETEPTPQPEKAKPAKAAKPATKPKAEPAPEPEAPAVTMESVREVLSMLPREQAKKLVTSYAPMLPQIDPADLPELYEKAQALLAKKEAA